jgi:hypothetical protein
MSTWMWEKRVEGTAMGWIGDGGVLEALLV